LGQSRALLADSSARRAEQTARLLRASGQLPSGNRTAELKTEMAQQMQTRGKLMRRRTELDRALCPANAARWQPGDGAAFCSNTSNYPHTP